MTGVCVLGPSGRMGATLIELLADKPFGLTLASALDSEASGFIGQQVADKVTVDASPERALAAAQVYIDFTTPDATANLATLARELGVAAIVGTTGLDAQAHAALATLSQTQAVLYAPNFSLGVNVLLNLAERAARALGPDFDLEVVEMHHKQKRDAPSGTAIALAQALADGRDLDLDEHKCYARVGELGARKTDEIGVMTVRGGAIVGEHTAFLIGEDERIEITHRAHGRSIFARGALRAAAWIASKPPGAYTMTQVLDL